MFGAEDKELSAVPKQTTLAGLSSNDLNDAFKPRHDARNLQYDDAHIQCSARAVR
jgi:hypothetical protein